MAFSSYTYYTLDMEKSWRNITIIILSSHLLWNMPLNFFRGNLENFLLLFNCSLFSRSEKEQHE